MDLASVLAPRWRLDDCDPQGLAAYCLSQYTKPLRVGAERAAVAAFMGPPVSRVRVDVVSVTGGDGATFPLIEVGLVSQYVIDGAEWEVAVGSWTPTAWGESRTLFQVSGLLGTLWGITARVDPAWNGGPIAAGFLLTVDRLGGSGLVVDYATGVTEVEP